MITHIINGTLLDTDRMELVGERHITIEDDKIVEVDASVPSGEADRVIDVKGRFVLPPDVGLVRFQECFCRKSHCYGSCCTIACKISHTG